MSGAVEDGGTSAGTWLILFLVWTLGLASWCVWIGAILYGIFRFFGG